MEDLSLILSLSGTILGLIITTVTFLMRLIKNEKAKKIAQQLTEVCNAVIPFIEEAEKSANLSGSEKKNYVLKRTLDFAGKMGIALDTGLVENKIEELIKFTKLVNKREKD